MAKIVIAEDDNTLASSLVSAFKERGFEVTVAHDGEEALSRIKDLKPDIALLDVMMPKMDGISVIWEMKADSETSDIPTVVLTNMADMDTVSKIMETGCKDYLLKSDQSVDAIIDKVNEVLSRPSKVLA